MINQSEIYNYLKSEKYSELISKLNEALDEDDSNPMYYFYRFLAYNQDYFHMNLADLIGEMDLNKSIDLEEDYSYIKEFSFIKELKGITRDIFVAVVRGNTKMVTALLVNPIEINKDIFPLFEAFLDNLEDKSLNLAARVLNHNDDIRKELSSDMLEYIYCPDESDSDYNLIIAGSDLIGVKGTPIVVSIPEEVKTIKKGVFKDITILRKVTMPSELKVIEEEAFYGCKNLHTIKLNKKLETIGAKAFSYTRITRIAIPKKLNKLGTEAFSYCQRLKQIRLPRNLYDIAEAVFKGCNSLKALAYSSIKYPLGYLFGKSKFDGAYKVEQGYDKEAYYVPSSLKKIRFLGNDMPDCACMNCKEINQVILSSQTVVTSQAFYGCKQLKTIDLPASVHVIGKYAFCDCENLEEVLLNSSPSLLDGAFMNCRRLKGFNKPFKESLPPFVFKGCTKLKKIKFLDLKYICEEAFADCESIKELSFGYDLIEIGKHAFKNCTNLETIEIKSSVKKIENGILSGCGNLKTIEFPFVVDSFGCLFSKNYYPNSIQLRDKNHTIYYYPKNLEYITILDGILPNGAFRDLTMVKTVDIYSVNSIPKECFYGCSNLWNVYIGALVESIGDYAFFNCDALKRIFIPKRVKKIGEHAFWGPMEIRLEARKPLFGRPIGFHRNWIHYKKESTIVWNALKKTRRH